MTSQLRCYNYVTCMKFLEYAYLRLLNYINVTFQSNVKIT